MGDVLCMDDIPFQCQSCESHFSSESSLKLHCFLEGHRGAADHGALDCDCGDYPDDPHQCDTCKLIGINVEGDRRIEKADDKVFAQSQLWKCSGCGMLWKCIDCGLYFKGSLMFKKHLPRCQNVEAVLKRMKREKGSDDESESKENKFIKEEKYNAALVGSIKEEKYNPDLTSASDIKKEIKEEKEDHSARYAVRSVNSLRVRQERAVTRLRVKQERDN